MGLGAVLPVAAAAALLPLGDSEARAWLHDRRLIRHIAGRRCVIWADVIEALRGAGDIDARVIDSPLPRVRL